MTKKFIDPRTHTPMTKDKLEKQLKAEEAKLKQFRTASGNFSQCIVIASYLNALGKNPVLPHLKDQKFYGNTPLWKTAQIEDGTPDITFKKIETPLNGSQR